MLPLFCLSSLFCYYIVIIIFWSSFCWCLCAHSILRNLNKILLKKSNKYKLKKEQKTSQEKEVVFCFWFGILKGTKAVVAWKELIMSSSFESPIQRCWCVSGRPGNILQWMGWTLLLSQSVPTVDSCILRGRSRGEEKKTCGYCRGYSGRCVILCICASVLFSECVLKGISTSLLFTVTGHAEEGREEWFKLTVS